MKNILPAYLLLFIVISCNNQKPNESRHLATNSGKLQIEPVLHSSFVMQWNGQTIYVDPHGGAGQYSKFSPADIILLTDIHGDHLDTATLYSLHMENITIIAPSAVAEKISDKFKEELTVIDNEERTTVEDIRITAIPMYNLPATDSAFHPKGRGNGYLLEMGGKRIYISGDTEDIPEMRSLKNIDIAFVCMNQPYTMTVEQAADAVSAFQPGIVYPYHFRGKDGFSDVGKFKELVTDKNENIEVRLADWYPKKN